MAFFNLMFLPTKARELKIQSVFHIVNTNIFAWEGTFYDYPFLSYCGYRNPDRYTDRK